MNSEKLRDMKKNAYSTPVMDIVMLKLQQALLIGSYDGVANAPEVEFGVDDAIKFDTDEVTFSDGSDLVHFND